MEGEQNQQSNQGTLEVRIPIETKKSIEKLKESKSEKSPRKIKISTLKKESTSSYADDQFDDESDKRIKELVEKTTKMAKESEKREKEMTEAFHSLREKLEVNDQFLKSKKEQLQNMIFQFERDKSKLSHDDHVGDCLENSNKTNEELESEMRKIAERIDKLRTKVGKIKEEQPEKDEGIDFKEALEKGISELKKLSCGSLKPQKEDQ